MPPSRADVERMVVALFTLNAGLDRARRDSPGAGRLSLLQVLTALRASAPPISPTPCRSARPSSPGTCSRWRRTAWWR